MVSGVGIIGNQSHDHITHQMRAGLMVELDYIYDRTNSGIINIHDYRFLICKQDILRGCAVLYSNMAILRRLAHTEKTKEFDLC